MGGKGNPPRREATSARAASGGSNGRDMAIERRRIIFSGRVQGVGFRATTSWVARGFDVAGHVRNLPDGTVEVVAEADPGEIDRFVEAVRERMSDFVRGVDSAPLAPGGPPLSGFRVRA